MARIKVTYGKRLPIGRVPEVYVEAAYEEDVPQGCTEEEFYQKCWQVVEREVEAKIARHREDARPRCERCGKTVDTLISMWDEETKENLQLCYEDYCELEKKRQELAEHVSG